LLSTTTTTIAGLHNRQQEHHPVIISCCTTRSFASLFSVLPSTLLFFIELLCPNKSSIAVALFAALLLASTCLELLGKLQRSTSRRRQEFVAKASTICNSWEWRISNFAVDAAAAVAVEQFTSCPQTLLLPNCSFLAFLTAKQSITKSEMLLVLFKDQQDWSWTSKGFNTYQ